MKEVSIVGAPFYGNRGAEAMVSTTIGKLRQHYSKDLKFNVFTYYPVRDRQLVTDQYISLYSSTPTYLILVLLPCATLFQLFGYLRLRFIQRLLPQSVKALARSKALICLAGVSFIEGRTKFIPFNIATILPAMLLGVPVIKFSQAMGPFNAQPNRLAARIFLGRCRQIFTRGEITHSYLSELLSDKMIYQRASDMAFLFRREFCLSQPADGLKEKLALLNVLHQRRKIIVGICPSVVIAVRAEEAGWDYIKFIRVLIRRLTDKGNVVALYTNATRGEDMDKSHNNDLPLLQVIYQDLEAHVKEHMVIFDNSFNVAQIHQIINECDVHVVSRFHAMISALASRIPVMVIGWSHKYLEVMQQFEQQDMVIDYKMGNIEPIFHSVEQLISERLVRTTQIGEALPKVQQLSNHQIDYVVQLLKSNA